MAGDLSGATPRFAGRAAVLPTLVLAGGAFAGYLIARQASAPGDLSALVYTWLIPLAFVASLLALAGYTGRLRSSEPEQMMAPTQVMWAGIALALGTVVGLVATPLLGLTYAPQVVLQATGPAALELAGVADYEPTNATATCQSVADGQTVDQVAIDQVGTLRGVRLIAVVGPDPTAASGETIDIELSGDTGQAILWQGTPRVTLGGADGRTGSATFEDIVGQDESLKVGPLNQPAPIDPWPATLTGTLTWSCGDWHAGASAVPRT